METVWILSIQAMDAAYDARPDIYVYSSKEAAQAAAKAHDGRRPLTWKQWDDLGDLYYAESDYKHGYEYEIYPLPLDPPMPR